MDEPQPPEGENSNQADAESSGGDSVPDIGSRQNGDPADNGEPDSGDGVASSLAARVVDEAAAVHSPNPSSSATEHTNEPPTPPRAPTCPAPDEISTSSSLRLSQWETHNERRMLTQQERYGPRRRRIMLPLILFAITCISTFWAGATHWYPPKDMTSTMAMRQAVIRGWDDGLIYMGCVLAILMAHEMGHFLATVRYRIPASLPFFIPVPITPIGTMGAVIGMDGLRANRRELFDIGLAGPLAGLVLAVPIMWIGTQQLDFTTPPPRGIAGAHSYQLDSPLLVKAMLSTAQPPGYNQETRVESYQLNPFFMAGWVGLLITGLNMLPLSQLDGGHVIYTVFGKRAHWIARGFLFVAIAFIVMNWEDARIWMPMVIIVTLIGVDHPPTSNDDMPLGWFRTALGIVSLSIPVLCFPIYGFMQLN